MESPVTLESLRQALLALRTLFHSLLIIMLVLSGSLNIFLLRQVSLVRREVDAQQKFVDDYEKNGLPTMNSFVARLREFARANPDFVPILSKYGISPQAPPPASPSSARPSPGK